MLGLEFNKVRLVRYNQEWKKEFNREKKKIKKALGKIVIDIQHVGSTSIHKMPAKPIIDIGTTVKSLNNTKNIINNLNKIGYEQWKSGAKSVRLYFIKKSGSKTTHHLYVADKKSNYVGNTILFRDYLKKHKKDAEKYIKLKKELATKYSNNRKKYTASKSKFIKTIVKKSRQLKLK